VDNAEYERALEKFSVADNLLVRSQYWTVILRPKQITLGALVLIPNSPIDDFDAVAADEAADLFTVVARCQAVLREVFNADRFNLIAAMMKDHFVHFHLTPRYESDRHLAGMTWVDRDWPSLIDFGTDAPPPEDNIPVLDRLRIAFSGSQA